MTKANEGVQTTAATFLSSTLFNAQNDFARSLTELQAEIDGRFKELNDQFAAACTSSMGRNDNGSSLLEAQANYMRSWNTLAPAAQQDYVKRASELYRGYLRAAQDAMAQADLNACSPMELAAASQLLYAASYQAFNSGVPWQSTP